MMSIRICHPIPEGFIEALNSKKGEKSPWIDTDPFLSHELAGATPGIFS